MASSSLIKQLQERGAGSPGDGQEALAEQAGAGRSRSVAASIYR